MKTSEQKGKLPKVQTESKQSKYAGKQLNSTKEKAAKEFEVAAMEILKQHGLTK